ncbi:MAG: RNA methyltransferase [Chlamydiota bacterium]
MVIEITSVQNPKVKIATGLADRRDRDRSGLFLIEGFREITRALQGDVIIEQVFFAESLFLGHNEPSLLEQLQKKGATLFSCKESVFRKISYRDRPDGLVAIARQMDTSFESFCSTFSSENPFLLVAEGIEKPGNLGTILRSCDAVGVDAAIVCDRCTDLFNPNVVRASVGTLFTQPIVEAKGQELLTWCKSKGIQVVAATPHAEKEFTETDLSGPLAILVGTEQLGLSKLWMESADIQVSIPMRGAADSLNVATATTLLLYEVLRQRKQKGLHGDPLRR